MLVYFMLIGLSARKILNIKVITIYNYSISNQKTDIKTAVRNF